MAKNPQYSEVDAMGDVDKALSNIEPEAQQRVLDWAASKYQLRQTKGTGHDAGLPLVQRSDKPPSDIKSFVAQKRPDGFYERIACLVYYMEKFQEKADIGRQEIIQANSDARLSK